MQTEIEFSPENKRLFSCTEKLLTGHFAEQKLLPSL